MSLKSLEDLFLHELKDVYHAEKQITKALPKMIKATASDDLRTALEEHLEVTENQVVRLERIFEILGKAPRGKRCVGMEGLLEEGSELMKEEDAAEAVIDAGLIASAQKVEHYEICAYGTLSAYAQQLGMDEAVELLQATLAEEKEADETLTELASHVNFEAESEEAGAARKR